MLTKKQMKFMKIMGTVLFSMATFAALFGSLYIINGLKNYGKSTSNILLTSFGLTLLFTMEYVLVWKPLRLMIKKWNSRNQ